MNRFRSVLNTIPFLAIAGIATLLVVIFNPLQPEALSAIAFKDFPVNKTQIVEFSTNSESFQRLSDREKTDQQLDWLVYAIASDRDFTADRINQSLHDLPPVRYGYNSQIANFEYGKTRHINLGNNIVAAIVPKISAKENRSEDIAHIADEYRKDVGKIPENIQIFEYDLNSDGKSANLTHTSDLKGEEIFSEKYNYHEAKISSRSDLENFTKQVKDLTYAHRDGNHLVLGGRKSIGRPTLGINVEDIAALWQSYQESSSSGFSLDPTYDYDGLTKELDKYQSFLKSLKVNNKSFITDADIQRVKSDLSEQDITSYLSLVKRTGSKKIDTKDIEKEFKGKVEKARRELEIAQQSGKSQEELDSLVKQKKAVLFASFKKLFAERTTKIDNFIDTPSIYGFQSARYDGKLQGTQVGMTLFYTDLLAKLWALDYQTSTPSKVISDFRPLTKVASSASSIYQQESQELSGTRLWFGHQDKGFQITDKGNSLLFDRNATRIYAKSANQLTPKQETTANWGSAYFLGWWNDRYEEVASYEPQYERLNQIMKWSYLMGWLEGEKQDNPLAFLQTEHVQNGETFPHWVEANKKQLKFQSWDSKSQCKNYQIDSQTPVCFYDRGYKGTTTESMPLLRSGAFKQFGNERHYIQGGVSLAEKQLFQNRKALPTTHDIIEPGLRSGIDYENGFSKIGNNGFSFKTREGVIYKITQPDKSSKVIASNTVQAAAEMKLRSPVSEVANLEFSSNISRVNDGIQINTTAKGIPVGDFATKKTPNGFSVGLKSRDIDAGQSLALDLSRSKQTVEAVLENHPNVQSAYTDGSAYYIETKNSTHLLELTPESGGGGKGGGGKGGGGTGGGGNEPPDWHSRVGFPGDPKESNGNYKLFWKEKKNEYKSGKTRIVDRGQIKDIPPIKTGKSLDDIDRALKQQNPQIAMAMIYDEIATHGRTPTLLFRQAVAHVKQGKLKIQSLVFDPLQSNWIEKKGNFLNEVQGILNGNSKFKVIKKDDAFIYVQDTPGLNNIDWDRPIESALPSSSSTKSRVYQLHSDNASVGGNGGNGNNGGNGGLSDFGYEPENPKPIGTPARDYQVSQGSFSQYPIPKMAGNSDDKCEDGVIKDVKCMKVYVVIETPELEKSIEYSNPQ